MNRHAKWFFAIVAAQVIFLLAWAGYHEAVRHSATTIVLKGHPVDPQDLLRGDYMTLRYDISDAPIDAAKSLSASDSNRSGDGTIGRDVWVLLEPRARYHVIAEASYAPLTPQPGQVLVRGTTSRAWGNAPANSRIAYGIERYFVPEGKGTPSFKLLEVEAAVGPDHRLAIKRVLLDGHAYP